MIGMINNRTSVIFIDREDQEDCYDIYIQYKKGN